ncbi:unnamed protein product [Arabis nemorensis]|uniref:Uncharacterized protein n=1 Tax=Arabis nemorensis TaxID=586526 RepID=A0A565CME6_9BRAS|nr:unnamed protein product [Arabis nemorensis]
MSLWKATGEALVKAKSNLKAIEENIIPKLTAYCGLGEQDMRALKEAWMLVVQCRQALKWSSLFGYVTTEDQTPKKPYLNHLEGEANKVLLKRKETLHELINEAISAGDITCFKHKVETSTKNTGNYFHYFLKMLEDGLPEVEVGVDEDASTNYWFCEQCKFQNGWGDREYKGCFILFDCVPPPSHVDFGNNNT